MVELGEATGDDLAALAAAGESYRRHWDSFRSMPDRGATFAGAVADAGALDYLDYEQLGHPPGGLAAAALVWGNVFVVQCGLRWLRSAAGDLWLGAEMRGGVSGVAWPYARLAEVMARDLPQFGKFGWLMQRVAEELVSQCDLSPQAHARLRRLQAVLEVGEQAVADAEPSAAADPRRIR